MLNQLTKGHQVLVDGEQATVIEVVGNTLRYKINSDAKETVLERDESELQGQVDAEYYDEDKDTTHRFRLNRLDTKAFSTDKECVEAFTGLMDCGHLLDVDRDHRIHELKMLLVVVIGYTDWKVDGFVRQASFSSKWSQVW